MRFYANANVLIKSVTAGLSGIKLARNNGKRTGDLSTSTAIN